MSIAAIVPMKNEKGNVDLMVNSISKLDNLTEVVFIDGDSKDGTYEALIKSTKKLNDKRVKVIRQTRPLGKFNAIKQSYLHVTSKNILIWDGDNTIPEYDIKKIIDLYEKLSQNDEVFVVANRINSNKQSKSFRALNLLGNHVMAFLMKLILKDSVPDVLSGAKIFPKYIMSENYICNKAISLDNFGDLFLLSNCNKFDIRIVSVPCNYQVRFYGKTSIRRWSGGINMCRVLIHIILHRCYKVKL